MKKRTAAFALPISALFFPLFVVFSYPYLPESIPMQFSMTGEVNWTLPTTTAIIAFATICMFYGGYVIIRYSKADVYPKKDILIALLLPLFFSFILAISIFIK